ncbi:cytochrome cd1-nitrite reductase-like protein [Hypoxylon trugodes]|uniref:cytochrome cd1-nitrite reductase-like protein n=1 Tax=Hypoxylon trugodes TaxID=326681 RepID=UPI00218D24C8|nr:cytochrome cd1-nitrite reductase-like protein [Hypoxylon trugodes]KAI1387741.1 cytochrome cd1-nitrite reductase-like protein [Hypoxylon trugodes]
MARSIAYWVAAIANTAITAAAILASPQCQNAAPTQTTINVPTANMSLPGSPFGLVYARNDIAFAGMGHQVIMLNTTTFKPTLAREFPLPALLNQSQGVVSGLTLSHDKRYVYASVGPGAVILDVEKAVAGDTNPIVGLLRGTTGDGAIQVTLSKDDKYALVTQEYGTNATLFRGTIEVFQIHHGLNGSIAGTSKGYTRLGYAVVGTAFSHDESKLYVTSEVTSQATSVNETRGTLSVLDVAILKTDPSKALLHTVDAGCSPVRLAVSPDGKQVWVTARLSNKLLAFDTEKLDSAHPEGALRASVQVGTSPVGIAIVNRGRHIITADSNRFNYANATTGLTVVGTEAALWGNQGFPRILTGLFPREFAVSPDGKTLLVSEYRSKAIQAVDITRLL